MFIGGDNIKCPYCNIEMIEGQIHNGSEVLGWLPEGTSKSLYGAWWSFPDNGIRLSKKHWLYGYKVKAYLCKNCNKIIIDVPSLEKNNKK